MSDEKNKLYRDSCERRHRVIANYLAVRAWWRGADCVVLSREILREILGVDRLKEIRLTWFQEDIKRWFPYSNVRRAWMTNAVNSVFLARTKVDMDLFGKISPDVGTIYFSESSKIDFSEAAMI